MKTIDIIIPVHNQYSSLCKCLYAFNLQNLDKAQFFITIVDDGSTDELADKSWNDLSIKYDLTGQIIRQLNKGRAAARNVGIEAAKSDIVIFCDADRFPKKDFIQQHLEFHENGAEIVIGASYDYFGKWEYVSKTDINWDIVLKYSRLSSYFKNISCIYNSKGQTVSKLAWLSFLVGNLSVKKSILADAGMFDETFVEWGFEHFEIAYRMWLKGYHFSLNKLAANYHIPHRRDNNFYVESIAKNASFMCKKHPEIKNEILSDFVSGKIGINLAEYNMYKEQIDE